LREVLIEVLREKKVKNILSRSIREEALTTTTRPDDNSSLDTALKSSEGL